LEAESAVRALAEYRGSDVTELLLNIALGKEASGQDVRIIAIESLQARGGAPEATALSNLIQPHQALELRRATAKAIEGMPCNDGCVASILHYLERISVGERNDEDLREDLRANLLREMPNAFTRHDYAHEQKEIYHALENVLRRERSTTLAALVQTYGLASGFPSPFALALVSRVGLTEACSFLVNAEKSRAITSFRDEKLLRALEAVPCVTSN